MKDYEKWCVRDNSNHGHPRKAGAGVHLGKVWSPLKHMRLVLSVWLEVTITRSKGSSAMEVAHLV